MKEFQETDFYPPPLSAQGIEHQLKKGSQNGANSSNNGLLGRFLKLGKSKSDVHTSNYIKRRQAQANTNGANELEDDFVLAPVQLRGVEKMVHRAHTKKENVSRSHSWIYGSVKLPSDLPFGYGYDEQIRTVPGEKDSDMCQASEFFKCSCNDDFCNYITSGSTSQPNVPCRACSAQLVPSSGNRKFLDQLQQQGGESSKKLANSVRKLTWKSLKQAVKKRPSLDSLLASKKPEVGNGASQSSGNYMEDFLYAPSTTANYFFPEKKHNNFYASCTDLFSLDQHVTTASVRLRPKRSRPTWEFPNEFGPVSNYAEGIYHSEWDLRQCAMPYEQWLTTSNNSRPGGREQFLDDIFSSPVSNVKIQNKGSNKPKGEIKTNGVSINNGTTFSNGTGSGTLKSSELYSNGGVKRFSILHNETASAYQLNKQAEESEGSDDGSPLMTDDPVRIAGQGIFMVGSNSTEKKVTRSNSTSSAKFKGSGSFGSTKGNHPHHLLLSATTSEADGVWSDTQVEDEPVRKSPLESLYSPESKASVDQNVLKTFKQHHLDLDEPKRNDIPSVSKKSIIKSTAKGNPSDGDNKYGALRRRRMRTPGGKTNLLRETIEEEPEIHEPLDELHSVKILVSQTSAVDYVKPILKTRIASCVEESGCPTDDIYDSTDLVSRSPRKVQFNNAREEIVISSSGSATAESESDENEEVDKIVNDYDYSETKSQHQIPSRKEISIETTLPSPMHHPKVSSTRIEQLPPVVKPNGVNNLGSAKEVNPIKMNGDPAPSVTRGMCSDYKMKSQGAFVDEKMILSKLKRMQNSKAERISIQNLSGDDKDSNPHPIVNPNSLLFNDTTRIRLNQIRPSLQNTFHLSDVTSNRTDVFSGTTRKVRPSQSFRSSGSTSVTLRPKEPPPPPPRISSVPAPPSLVRPGFPPCRTNKSNISLPMPNLGFSTTNDLVNQPSHYQNTSSAILRKNKPKMGEKCGTVLMIQQHPPLTPSSALKPLKANDPKDAQNIEIVTRDNSVSEIRIYSGPSSKPQKPLPAPKDPSLIQTKRENHYASTEISRRLSNTMQMNNPSRPQSTSVVLIIDTSSTGDRTMSNQNSTPNATSHPTDPPVRNQVNSSSVVGQTNKQHEIIREMIYDDVINSQSSHHLQHAKHDVTSQNGHDVESYQSVYSDVGMSVSINSQPEEMIYDDTPPSVTKVNELADDILEDEPLYDDILNVISSQPAADSDSGTETDVPPPLPASGPPVHLLPEISLELPVIPLPVIPSLVKPPCKSVSKGNNRLLEDIIEFSKRMSNGEGKSESKLSPEMARPLPQFQLSLPEDPINTNGSQDDALLDRTRTLLHELNEKLANLNFSPQDYSSHISKVIISSSSDSSGVEEDYNSEKNYSLSNDGGSGASSTTSQEESYKLSKLVTDTISMARGKFLDSMKITGGQTILTSAANVGSDGDEPIYEEINDSTKANSRSTSPIYADAFDAKSIFDGASRSEILSFLESIRDRLAAAERNPAGARQVAIQSVKKSRRNTEVVRNDSGIGSESGSLSLPTPPSTMLRISPVCQDCNDSPVGTTGSEGFPNPFCCSCSRKRNERKEIVQEIYETELKYGRDLRIISDEFYIPIQTAGLLSKDQLDQIFLNVDQLIEVNSALSSSLKSAITTAIQSTSDQDLNSVNVGRIFLEIGEKMMSTFETYCTRQASAGALLTQIEKEKELLRIFLRVSQMENTVLRRMNLPAFLMVPVQRVTRYPLLLSRLLKVTASDHPTREELELAQEKIETHLEHMNKTTREVATVKLWRRISIMNGAGNGSITGVSGGAPLNRRSNSDFDSASVRIRKMALDVLDWTSFKDVSCVIESQLNMVQCNSSKSMRHVYAILLVRGKDLERLALRIDQETLFPPKEDVVKDVKLVLVRAKNARFNLFREPLCLAKCVISRGEAEFQEFIEINEIITKNTYYLQALDKPGTSLWLKLLQSHALCVGHWRRRRGALANIMMNGMMRHL